MYKIPVCVMCFFGISKYQKKIREIVFSIEIILPFHDILLGYKNNLSSNPNAQTSCNTQNWVKQVKSD